METSPGRRRSPTLEDVARLAGVSHQTVSRVVNDYPHIRPEVRERVGVAIRQLGYRRNRTARDLARGRSHVVGVVVADLGQTGPAAALAAVEVAARAAGYGVTVVTLAGPGGAAMDDALGLLAERAIEGIVVVAEEDVEARAARLRWVGPPIVTLGASAERDDRGVEVDTRAGARLAVRHLAELGHVGIRHLAGPVGYRVSAERRAGWESELAAHGLRAALPVAARDWSPAAGYVAGRELARDRGMTAVFAANDDLALGLLLALHEAGRAVPGEVSVVGYDDDPRAAFTIPPLTTVRQDFARLGALAVARLLAAIADDGRAPESGRDPQELVVRASTATPLR